MCNSSFVEWDSVISEQCSDLYVPQNSISDALGHYYSETCFKDNLHTTCVQGLFDKVMIVPV